MKLEFYRQIFEGKKYWNVKFRENSSIWDSNYSRGMTDGRTDMTQIVAFMQFREGASKQELIGHD